MGSFASQPARESARLQAVAALNLCDGPAECPLDDLAALAAEVFGTPYAAVSIVDENTQIFLGRSGVVTERVPRESAFCAHVVASAAPFFVTDARRDPRTLDNRYVAGAPFLRHYGGVPVLSQDGHVLGVFCVFGKDVRAFNEADRERLHVFARLAAERLQSHVREIDLAHAHLQCAAAQARGAAVLDEAAAAFTACDKLALNLSGRFSGALARLENAAEQGARDVAAEIAVLRELAGDLATLARLEAPRSAAAMFEPSALVRDLVEDIAAFPANENASIDLHDSARGVEMLGDPLRFEELLENLLCDVLSQGSGPVSLSTRFENTHCARASFVLKFSGEAGWETHEPWAVGARARDLIEAMSGAYSNSCDEHTLVVTLPARLCAPVRGASAANVVSLEDIKRGKAQ